MKIGLLGAGLMGEAMAKRLLETKMPLVAYNRTHSKLTPLKEAGAEIADRPELVIQTCECIILMLTDATAIESVLLSENSLSFLKNRTVIQMGTIDPIQSKSIGDAVVAAGGEYLEAPVLGSIPEAKNGELLVMVGATETQFQKWYDLLKNFSPAPMLIGEVGTAAALKLALNQLIAGLTGTFALSLAFVQQQGVNVEQFMEILRQSALYAPTFAKKLQRMLEENYANPNFPTKHLLKDTNLFLDRAEEIGLDISSLTGMRQIIQKAIELGLADADYSAIFSAIKGNNSPNPD